MNGNGTSMEDAWANMAPYERRQQEQHEAYMAESRARLALIEKDSVMMDARKEQMKLELDLREGSQAAWQKHADAISDSAKAQTEATIAMQAAIERIEKFLTKESGNV